MCASRLSPTPALVSRGRQCPPVRLVVGGVTSHDDVVGRAAGRRRRYWNNAAGGQSALTSNAFVCRARRPAQLPQPECLRDRSFAPPPPAHLLPQHERLPPRFYDSPTLHRPTQRDETVSSHRVASDGVKRVGDSLNTSRAIAQFTLPTPTLCDKTVLSSLVGRCELGIRVYNHGVTF